MKHIKKFKHFVTEKKSFSSIKENYNQTDLKIVADAIKNGETSGEMPIEWELEVSVKDWIKLEDEDIDYIATLIENGEICGNDPIEWCISFEKDTFDEEQSYEEEENYSRKNIADELSIDETDFEDSLDLGDLADDMIQSHNDYDFALDEATILFDTFLENNDVSKLFTKTMNSDFDYDKEKYLYNSVINYYHTTFIETEGYLDEFGSNEFKMALKDIIAKYLK
jgi:hypothetical protein